MRNSASKSNTSLNKCSQNGASSGINRLIVRIPTVKVIGKPIAKIDNCGETRFNKPSTKFSMRSKTIKGNANIMPLRKIKPADFTNAIKALAFIVVPLMGSV